MKKLFLLLFLTGIAFGSMQAGFYQRFISTDYSLTGARLDLSNFVLMVSIINTGVESIIKKSNYFFPRLPAALLISGLLTLGLPDNEIRLPRGISFNLNAKRLLTLSALTYLGIPGAPRSALKIASPEVWIVAGTTVLALVYFSRPALPTFGAPRINPEPIQHQDWQIRQ